MIQVQVRFFATSWPFPKPSDLLAGLFGIKFKGWNSLRGHTQCQWKSMKFTLEPQAPPTAMPETLLPSGSVFQSQTATCHCSVTV